MPLMWRDLIASLATDVTFAPGATESSIAATEDALAVRFPDQLRSMLLESNGVLGEYDLGWYGASIEFETTTLISAIIGISLTSTCHSNICCFCGRWQRRPVRLSHSKR